MRALFLSAPVPKVPRGHRARFRGYAGMFASVVPLWVARGGSGEFGAGLDDRGVDENTVGTQLLVPADAAPGRAPPGPRGGSVLLARRLR
ncbi:hypothetical protein HBB16_03120 [Pseudonocardia sp. MCCB 268]|nr:hypothetical protein [Pseudonocardia cytotoxica]